MNIPAHGFEVVAAHRIHFGDITVTNKFTVFIVVARRKRHDFIHKSHQVFRLTGKYDGALCIITVIEGPYTDRVPGRNIRSGLTIINNADKFRIQHGKHICAVFTIHRE